MFASYSTESKLVTWAWAIRADAFLAVISTMHGLFVTGSTCDNDDKDFRDNRLKCATLALRMIRLL
jgi:hypothetical protein